MYIQMRVTACLDSVQVMFYYHVNLGYDSTKNKKVDVQNFLELRITYKGFVGLFFKSELAPAYGCTEFI